MRGSCLCGAVKYQIDGGLRPIVGCHCTQCRKTSGHYVAATQALSADLRIDGVSNLSWYQSSESAKRGFCKTCGSQLFWTEFSSAYISIMAGTIDGETGLVMNKQIHSELKGDYYSLPNVETVNQTTL